MGSKDNNEALLEELSKQHGRIASVEVDGKLHVFRAPTLDEYEDMQEALTKKRRGVVYRELAQILCVTDHEALRAAFQAYPAFPAVLSDTIAEMAGATVEITVKKG